MKMIIRFILIPCYLLLHLLAIAQPAVLTDADSIIIPDKSSYATPPSTLDMMVGQMIMVGTHGTILSVNPLLQLALKDGIVGGVILFEKNISQNTSALQLKILTLDLQQTSKYPLFIAIDQEGGRVNRLKTKYGFPPSLSAMELGQADNPDSTLFYGQQTAKTLAMLGININFAPVVDLCTNPDNPVIAKAERCYSADPEMVAKHALLTIEAHHQQGVLTTLKHFPGHGSSKKDTHLEMTDITDQWISDELIPYKKLIASGHVDAIMTAHIVHCKLDTSCLPATLSNSIVQQLLRNKLEYNGVVFSDDMQMHAITKHFGLEKSILLAIQAGIDILIFSNNIRGSEEHQATVVHRIIMDLVQSGQISEERIRASYERVIVLKKKLYPQYPFPL